MDGLRLLLPDIESVRFEQTRHTRPDSGIAAGAFEIAAALGRLVLERSRVEFPNQPGFRIGHATERRMLTRAGQLR